MHHIILRSIPSFLHSSLHFLFRLCLHFTSFFAALVRFKYSTLFAIAISSFAMFYALCLPMISSHPARSISDNASSDAFAFALRLDFHCLPSPLGTDVSIMTTYSTKTWTLFLPYNTAFSFFIFSLSYSSSTFTSSFFMNSMPNAQCFMLN